MRINSGVYCICFSLARTRRFKVGKLGSFALDAGEYIYVGSARQGLWQRVTRHLQRKKKPRWHIDFLTGCRDLRGRSAILFLNPAVSECTLSRGLSELNATPAIMGFGASDCKQGCPSHLWWSNEPLGPSLIDRFALPTGSADPVPGFQQLIDWVHWQAIPDCPGRYRLVSPPSTLDSFWGWHAVLAVEKSNRARDPVLVVPLADGGALLSYLRRGHPIRHTLNTPEGFVRKARQLQLALENRSIVSRVQGLAARGGARNLVLRLGKE